MISEEKELEQLSPFLSGIRKDAMRFTFRIPEGYFETAGKRTANLTNSQVFSTPEHYFEELPERIIAHPLVTKSNPFATPPHYFENLAERVAEICNPGPLASGFETPEGYFSRLPYQIQERVHRKKAPSQFRGSLKPVFALATLFLVITGAYLWVDNQPVTPKKQTALIAPVQEIPQTDGNEALDLFSVDEDLLMEELNTGKSGAVSVAVSHEAISDYLIENDVDLSALSNEI